MGYTITTLVENCVYGRKLQAEHGLSPVRVANRNGYGKHSILPVSYTHLINRSCHYNHIGSNHLLHDFRRIILLRTRLSVHLSLIHI